jgi:hypothetical protein
VGILFILFVVFMAGAPLSAMSADKGIVGSYLKSPLFFEMFYEEYYDDTNLDLLPGGTIHIHPFGIRDVVKFSWVEPKIQPGAKEFSWWVRLESLRYLLPFIGSSETEHRIFLRGWFERWYEHHKGLEAPNKAAWESMTTGIRAMVLAFYLKHTDMQVPKDDLLISHLRDALLDHQSFLAKEENFSRKSNHGMWEALGLFETTRVHPDSGYARLALERLQYIIEKSVSKMGIHKEHSPGYHFHFLRWMQEYTTYLRSLPHLPWTGLQLVEEILQDMVDAAYFLQDHDGNIPTIRDTDESTVPERWLLETTSDKDGVYFDKEAGYAIYKDGEGRGLRRYIIFNIQNRRPNLPYHFHNDALAVYFNCDGETILGDQGRYEYGYSSERTYFQSFSAHNTIIPFIYLDIARGSKQSGALSKFNLVSDPSLTDRGDAVLFSAGNSFIKIMVDRRVLIPKKELMLKVRDRIVCSANAVVLWNIGPDVEEIIQQKKPSTDQCLYVWKIRTKKKKNYLLSISVKGQSDKDKVQMLVFEGSLSPMLGWYTPGYLEKVPSKVILLQLSPARQMAAKVVTQVTHMD